MQTSAEEIIASLYPGMYRSMVVALSSYLGFASLADAEDLVQDTFATAVKDWNSRGIPAQPENWLFKVCKNKALNFLKKQKVRHKSPFAPPRPEEYQLQQAFSESEIADNELRMIYACCHARFSQKAQLILILKSLCGFSTEKVAHSLAMQPEAVRKLHYRTLQTIREEQLRLNTPQLLRLAERTSNVHRTIYLLFNEGYLAYHGTQLLSYDCCLEALRLIRLMLSLPPVCTADSHALYALFLFHLSRINARTGQGGELVELEHQNRGLWQQDMIQLGIHHLNKALSYQQALSRYQLEALIASLHCTAPSFEKTDWEKVSGLYNLLLEISPGPYMTLNKAIALYFSLGADAAHSYLSGSSHLEFLQEQCLYHSFMGRIFQEQGDLLQARAHYQQGISLAQNQLEKDFMQRKLNHIA